MNIKHYKTETFYTRNQAPKGERIILKNLYLNLILKRNLSRDLPKLNTNPVVRYNNAELQKNLILKENINKSFVYRWTNKINGKDYLGSTSNAKRRLLKYFDRYSLNLSNMPIYKALLKYGHSNFIFDIIEFCEPKDAIQREQFYLDHFDFDYNVLEKANSSLGYKHTKQTLAKLKGRKNLLGYKHNLETINKLRENQLNKKHSVENLNKMREIWAERKLNSSSLNLNETQNVQFKANKIKIKGKIVVVTNIDTNLSTEYISISEAALSLNITRTTLRTYVKNKTVFNLLKQDPIGKGILKENFLITIKDN